MVCEDAEVCLRILRGDLKGTLLFFLTFLFVISLLKTINSCYRFISETPNTLCGRAKRAYNIGSYVDPFTIIINLL